MVVEYIPALINDTYPIVLPAFRKTFHADRPNWERGRLESCAELMKPGMTVYDIGAECGDFTALYKSFVGDTGDVIPIEPADHQWPFIAGTFEANHFPPPAMTFVGLVGDSNVGKRGFERRAWPKESNGDGIPDGGFVHLQQSPRVNRTTIDTLANVIAPDAIVLDIEGAEYLALQGAVNTLKTHRPFVWVSVHDVGDDAGWPGPLFGWYKHTARDIDEFMDELDYDREELPSHGEGERFLLYRPR